jgi:hypothetical protein
VLHLREFGKCRPRFLLCSEDTASIIRSSRFQYQTIYIMMIDKIVWLHSNPRMIRFSFDLISWSVALRAMTIDSCFFRSTQTDLRTSARSSISGTLVAIRNAIKGINRTVSHTSSSMLQNRKAYIELRAPYLCMNISSDSRISIALIPVHNRNGNRLSVER